MVSLVYCCLLLQMYCTKKQAVKNCKTSPVPGTLRGKTAIPNAGATENTEVITASTASKIQGVSLVYQDGEFTTVISHLCLQTIICSRPFQHHPYPRKPLHVTVLDDK